MTFTKRILYGIEYVKTIIRNIIKDEHNDLTSAHAKGFTHNVTISTTSEPSLNLKNTNFTIGEDNSSCGGITFMDKTNTGMFTMDCDCSKTSHRIQFHMSNPSNTDGSNQIVCDFVNDASAVNPLYLDMRNHYIHNAYVVTPTQSNHIANKQYVETYAAPKSHTHSIANVTNLQSALNGKSNTNHTHTASSLSGVLGVAASSLAQRGYVKLTNGLIIQWGKESGQGTKYFPIAFPSTCFSITASFNTGDRVFSAETLTNSYFNAKIWNTDGKSGYNGTFWWIAIGK